ncbi:hypothetical protein CCP3SC1_190049 [Gammaproteobacteria bacterium]
MTVVGDEEVSDKVYYTAYYENIFPFIKMGRIRLIWVRFSDTPDLGTHSPYIQVFISDKALYTIPP